MKKTNEFLPDLHIGKFIKEIAYQNGVSSQNIADAICRYQKNASRIFKLNDMDVEDVIRISYLLKYNILNVIAKKYLSHIHHSSNFTSSEPYFLRIDMRNRCVVSYETSNNYGFLKNIKIGQHVREIASIKGLQGQDVAKKLQCSHGTITNLYKSKSLKVKTLIKVSEVLQYNFIAELYLSQMAIVPSLDKFDDCVISLGTQQITILNTMDKNSLMVFLRTDDKK